jgi:hypothetical protein
LTICILSSDVLMEMRASGAVPVAILCYAIETQPSARANPDFSDP